MTTTALIESQRPALAPQGHYSPGILNDYLAGQLTEGTKRIYQRDIRDFFDGHIPTLVQLKALHPNDLHLAIQNEDLAHQYSGRQPNI